MSLSMYDISVPVFQARLRSLSAILAKAEADAATRKFDPQNLLTARLAPDMLNPTKQVQIASDHAKGAPTRLAGREAVRFDDNETTFAELLARLGRVQELLASFRPEEFEGSETRSVEVKAGPRTLTFDGRAYLFDFAMPNFFFHITMAYAILRHNGVMIGKMDFLTA